MSGAALVRAVADAVAPVGLNLIGAVALAAYDALVPASHRLGDAGGARAAIVLGNGGGAFWAAYRAHAARHPGVDAAPHPLDAFTTTVLATRALPAATAAGARATLRLPFDTLAPPLSFVHLAEAAGLGRRGLVGVLIHPEFGPWMALRGALLVDVAVAAPRPAAHFDPCAACRERPCIAACPAGAIAAPAGWDVAGCIDHRLAHAGECHERCHARVACVYGRASRYPSDALAHHQARAFAAMTAARRAQQTG